MKTILVIEDDADIAFSLKYNLETSGSYDVTVVDDGKAGLSSAFDLLPSLVILDLNLPGIDGVEVCKQLRGDPRTATVPVIMVTARVEETERITGLDVGADDYVVKPFSVRELLARVRAVLRRSEGESADVEPEKEILRVSGLTIDVPGRVVRAGDATIPMTRKEFDLLLALIRNRGRVLTRARLLETVWGYDYPGETRTVDVHIRRLRQKLGDDGQRDIETVVGVGYRFRSAR